MATTCTRTPWSPVSCTSEPREVKLGRLCSWTHEEHLPRTTMSSTLVNETSSQRRPFIGMSTCSQTWALLSAFRLGSCILFHHNGHELPESLLRRIFKRE